MCPGAGCWRRKSAALMGKSLATSLPSTRCTRLGTLASATTTQSNRTIRTFAAKVAIDVRGRRQGQSADDQEHHGFEGPNLRHLEIRGEPLDDQPLLLRAAAGLEGIEVDVPAVGVDDGDRHRGE